MKTKIAVPVGAVLAGGALLHPQTILADSVQGAAPPPPTESCMRDVVCTSRQDWLASASADRITVSERDEWTSKAERRFIRLAELEATGTISSPEILELEILAERRSSLKQPRSGEEVLAAFEHRRLTAELIGSLQRYVQFHRATRKTSE